MAESSSSEEIKRYVPPYVVKLQLLLNQLIAIDFPPGPRFLPWYLVINLQKTGTLPFTLFLMMKYKNFSPSAYFYAAMHGGYGLVWILKHFIVRDPKWDQKQTLMGAINSILFVLGPYWLAPWLLISRRTPEPSKMRCLCGALMTAVGTALMVAADAYKSAALRYRPGLITDGPFKWVRHPNYTGEMLLYAGFAAIVPHWGPKAILAYVWLQVFLPNMLAKEASMSRYPQWAAYYARTGMLLPPLAALLPAKEQHKEKD